MGRITSITDALGNIIEVVDPQGNISRFEYDALNRMIKAEVNPQTYVMIFLCLASWGLGLHDNIQAGDWQAVAFAGGQAGAFAADAFVGGSGVFSVAGGARGVYRNVQHQFNRHWDNTLSNAFRNPLSSELPTTLLTLNNLIN